MRSAPLMNHLSIKGLMGADDEIEMEFTDESEDNVRLIYGLNGSGKSSVMRLIDAVLNWKPEVFVWKIPIDEFKISRKRPEWTPTDEQREARKKGDFYNRPSSRWNH